MLSEGEGKHAVTTCINCNERAPDHMRDDQAKDERTRHLCWFCRKQPDVLSEASIPLDLGPQMIDVCHRRVLHSRALVSAADNAVTKRQLEVDQKELAAREAWHQLQTVWPADELSVMEEALVSRVSSCVSVLQLPGCWSGGKQFSQLGYRGSVINFVTDLSVVAAQLPRAPKDTGIIVYCVEGVTKQGDAYRQLLRVRRDAVEAYLRFFARHHKLYVDGIVDPSNPGAYLVEPFREEHIDEAMLKSLPDDDVPEGVVERKLKAHEACGADANVLAPAEEEKEETAEEDKEEDAEETDEEECGGPSVAAAKRAPVPPQERDLYRRPIPESLLVRWVGDRHGPLAQHLHAKLQAEGIDVACEGGLNAMLCMLHGVGQHESRWTNKLTIELLAKRLHEARVVDGELLPAVVADELVPIARSMSSAFMESGVAHAEEPEEDQDPEESLYRRLQALLRGECGTDEAPCKPPPRGAVPLSEYRARGYTSLAFPTLFPLGSGDFGSIVDAGNKHGVTWQQWSRHVQKYKDGRFATHRRFPYFLLNTHEREVASRQANLFVKEQGRFNWTLGDVRKLDKAGKEDIMRTLSRFSQTLRNTPGFFSERRKELKTMCTQLGDPHVFATTSHADTHCPYLHKFIKTWAGIADDSTDDPEAQDITPDQCYARRAANLGRYPHIVATFFHLKMQLYVEHVCRGMLGADAWWMRYECAWLPAEPHRRDVWGRALSRRSHAADSPPSVPPPAATHSRRAKQRQHARALLFVAQGGPRPVVPRQVGAVGQARALPQA